MSLYIEYTAKDGKRHILLSSSFFYSVFVYLRRTISIFLSSQFFLLCLFILNMLHLKRGMSWHSQVFFIRYFVYLRRAISFFLSAPSH